MTMPDYTHRLRELSHAFFLATLLVAVVSVTGAVFSLTLFVQRTGISSAVITPTPLVPPDPVPSVAPVPIPVQEPAPSFEPQPPPPEPPPPAPSISASPSAAAPGQIVTVKVSNGPGNTSDWVGQYLGKTLEDWQFLDGTQTLPSTGRSSALLSFVLSSSGKHHFRFHAYSESGKLLTLATSPVVTVIKAPLPQLESPSPTAERPSPPAESPSPPAERPSPPPVGDPVGEPPPPRASPLVGREPLPRPILTPPAASVVSPIAPGLDVQQASTAAALVAVAVATPVTAATALTAAASLPAGFSGLSSSLFPLLAWVRPRRRPWGRVVEERTNLPVAGAMITILDASGRTRENVSSRNDGTFAALLTRGTYQFSVQHPRFAFAAAPAGITLFPEEQLYRGGSLDIKGEEGMAPLTPLVIGMKPTQPRRLLFRERARSRFERLRVLHGQLAIPVILIGAAINSLALWANPTPLLVSYEILYGVFLTFELLLPRVARRTLGRVRDAVAKNPVGLAIVRLLDTKTKRLVATRVTTPSGSFLLMPPPGNYRLQVSHAAYAPYTSEPLRIGRGGASAVRLKVDLVPGETPSARAI